MEIFRRLTTRPVCSLILLAVLAANSVALAQDEKEAVEEVQEAVQAQAAQPAMPMGPDVNRMVAAKRFQLTQVFAVEVDEIQRVCALDDAAKTKLTVGAKGAVSKLTAKWKKENGAKLGMMGGDVDADGGKQSDADADATIEVEIRDADEIDDRTAQMLTMDPDGNPFNAVAPTDDKFWKKTVNAVLTADQVKEWKEFRKSRDREKRLSLIDTAIRTIKVELCMSDEQSEKLLEVVSPVILEEKFSCPAFFEPFLVYYHASKVDEAKLREIFSPAQFQQWKMFMAPAREIGQLIELENAQNEVETDDD